MIDTLAAARTLETKGFTKAQAEGLAEALRAAVSEGVATKGDISELRTDLKADILELRTASKADIQELRAELSQFRADVKAEIASLKLWVFGSMIVIAGFTITVEKLFK